MRLLVFVIGSIALSACGDDGSSRSVTTREEGGVSDAEAGSPDLDAGDSAELDGGVDAGPPGNEGGPDAPVEAALPSGPTGIYVVAEDPSELAGETFFDHPWPSDLRLNSDGTVSTVGYPNPRGIGLFDQYLTSIDGKLHGFSPIAPGYLRFSEPVDPESLPAGPTQSLESGSSVQLIDVDPDSPTRGERLMLGLELHNDPGVHWPANTLAFAPAFGAPLRPSTLYAVVVTRAALSESGEAFGPSADLRQVLGLDTAAGAAEDASATLAPALDEIEAAGVPRNEIAQLAVFTTNDPTEAAIILRDHVRNEYPAPTVETDSWTAASGAVTGVMDVYEGQYGPSPDYQAGVPPYNTGNGELAFLADGTPDLQREFTARFVLVVPDATACPMPSNGYPMVLYAHGTGGDYRSYVRNGIARALAERCLASMGVDQIFQGTRDGSDVDADLTFLNLANLGAMRNNGPQSGTDVVQQARLFTESETRVPASVAATGSEIQFDPAKVMFFGHSQGAINGAIFLAADDQALGGVLSGSSGYIAMGILEKTLPLDMRALIAGLLMLDATEAMELTRFHPVLSLAQHMVDGTDPIHYASLIARNPRPDFVPKSLYVTEGVNPDGTGDTYAPPKGAEVFAVAAGLPPQEPIISPIEVLDWIPVSPVTIPSGGLSGNLGDGEASGVLAQWLPAPDRDGHFVVFDVPEATAQAVGFLENLAADPAGRVPAP